MTIYITAYGGERLDRIARKTLQTERQGAVEALLKANPGLGDLAAAGAGLVPAGTKIALPADFAPAPAAALTLAWE